MWEWVQHEFRYLCKKTKIMKANKKQKIPKITSCLFFRWDMREITRGKTERHSGSNTPTTGSAIPEQKSIRHKASTTGSRKIEEGDWVIVYDSSLDHQHTTIRKFAKR